MFHRWTALAVGLAGCALASASAWAQSPDTQPPQPPPRAGKLASLGQNYPNPFRPATFIPFTIEDCNGPGGHRVVSLKIYNVLAQLVATPVLHGAARPLSNMRLSCGDYMGYWDGKVARSHRPAASGVYVYELVVDGERTSKKMFMAK